MLTKIVLIKVSNDYASYFSEKAKLMRKHGELIRFRLLSIGNHGENRHQDNARATTAIGHRHTRALNNGGEMTICKKQQTFAWSDKRSNKYSKKYDSYQMKWFF